MTRIDDIKQAVQQLSAEELKAFRDWFAALQAQMWDQQLECDVAAGKLDKLAAEALSEHSAGQSRRLR